YGRDTGDVFMRSERFHCNTRARTNADHVDVRRIDTWIRLEVFQCTYGIFNFFGSAFKESRFPFTISPVSEIKIQYHKSARGEPPSIRILDLFFHLRPGPEHNKSG